jgi:hypothetical protein
MAGRMAARDSRPGSNDNSDRHSCTGIRNFEQTGIRSTRCDDERPDSQIDGGWLVFHKGLRLMASRSRPHGCTGRGLRPIVSTVAEVTPGRKNHVCKSRSLLPQRPGAEGSRAAPAKKPDARRTRPNCCMVRLCGTFLCRRETMQNHGLGGRAGWTCVGSDRAREVRGGRPRPAGEGGWIGWGYRMWRVRNPLAMTPYLAPPPGTMARGIPSCGALMARRSKRRQGAAPE